MNKKVTHCHPLKLKVGPAVLNITADVNRSDIQALQPTHVYACLERHISMLQVHSLLKIFL